MGRKISILILFIGLYLSFGTSANAANCSHSSSRVSFHLTNQKLLAYDNRWHFFSTATVVRTEYCLFCNQILGKNDNYKKLTNISLSHDFVNGKCQDCYYEMSCNHKVTQTMENGRQNISFRQYDSKNHIAVGGTFYYMQQCQDCGDLVGNRYSQSDVSLLEPHNFLNGKCKDCLYVNPCSHPTTIVDYNYHLIYNSQVKNNLEHTFSAYATKETLCSVCGTVLKKEFPSEPATYTASHGITSNGYCALCGYTDAITLENSSLSVAVSKTISIKASSNYNREITYKSSDPTIARVDANGNVTGVKVGTCKITVTAGTATATCKINVRPDVSVLSSDQETLTNLCMSKYATLPFSTLRSYIGKNVLTLINDNKGYHGKPIWNETTWGSRGNNPLKFVVSYDDLARICLADWRIAKVYQNDTTGFGATVFENIKNNQSVIAYRASGKITNWDSFVKDWCGNDFPLYYSGNIGPQLKDAINAYNDYKQSIGSTRTISFTGHSLGGGLANSMSTMMNLPADSFNSVPMFSNVISRFASYASLTFQGIDKLKFHDNISEHDILAGLWDTPHTKDLHALLRSNSKPLMAGLSGVIGNQDNLFEFSSTTALKKYTSYKDHIKYIEDKFSYSASLQPLISTFNILECHDMASIFTLSGSRFQLTAKIEKNLSPYSSTSVVRFPAMDGQANTTDSVASGAYIMPQNLITVVGASGSQTISSQESDVSAELFFGGDGHDTISALSGNDHLIGGHGNDSLSGGAGNDRYIYVKGNGLDTIHDITGDTHIYLLSFDPRDKIEYLTNSYTDDLGFDYHEITCNGTPIIRVCSLRSFPSIISSITNPWLYIHRDNSIYKIENSTDVAVKRYAFKCPLTVSVYDKQGNLLITLTSGEEKMILKDFGHFYVYKEQDGSYGKILELFDDYTIVATGEGSGTFSVEVGDVYSDDWTPYGTANMPVQKGSKITFSGDSPSNMVVSVDHDNDGIADEIMQLTADLQGALLSELPQTGDNTPYAFYFIALAVSASLFFLLKKRNRA